MPCVFLHINFLGLSLLDLREVHIFVEIENNIHIPVDTGYKDYAMLIS
jgi:hypothetical protein